MQYGLHVSSCGEYADARILAELAHQAESAGWDGFFIWDHMAMSPPEPQVDPWVALAAIALATERIRIGTMVSPLARQQPWQVARATASLDRLSDGRMVLGVGLGDSSSEFEQFGLPEGSSSTRAVLDEALEIITGLWSGEPFNYHGTHYHIESSAFTPTPIQRPGIPIWVAGFWPRKGPFRRAARFDGVFPGKIGGKITPEDLHELLAFIQEHRSKKSKMDVIIMEATP